MKKIRFGLGILLVVLLVFTACDNGGDGSYEDFEELLEGFLDGNGTPNNTVLAKHGLGGKNLASLTGIQGYRGWGDDEDLLIMIWTGVDSSGYGKIVSTLKSILGGDFTDSDGYYVLNYGSGHFCVIWYAEKEETTTDDDGKEILIPPGTVQVNFV
jgi:hypothetical protein